MAYGRIWPCMAVYSCIWPYMAVYGCIWLYMVVYGCIWLYMAVDGCIWLYMAVYSCIWLYMAVYGCMHFCRRPSSVAASGNQRIAVFVVGVVRRRSPPAESSAFQFSSSSSSVVGRRQRKSVHCSLWLYMAVYGCSGVLWGCSGVAKRGTVTYRRVARWRVTVCRLAGFDRLLRMSMKRFVCSVLHS